MHIGMVGSPAHILTNEKIEGKDKLKTIGKVYAEAAKDTLTIGGVAAGTGAAVAAATKFNKGFAAKVAQFAGTAKEATGNILSKIGIQKTYASGKKGFVSVKGVVENKLKELANNKNSLYSKFKGLPTYAKAGIAAGVAALAVVGNIIGVNSVAKAGKIEGEAEKKDVQPKAKKKAPIKTVAAMALGLPAIMIAKANKAEEDK